MMFGGVSVCLCVCEVSFQTIDSLALSKINHCPMLFSLSEDGNKEKYKSLQLKNRPIRLRTLKNAL